MTGADQDRGAGQDHSTNRDRDLAQDHGAAPVESRQANGVQPAPRGRLPRDPNPGHSPLALLDRTGRTQPGDETLRIEVAVAKVPKYASRESGDTVEVTERPHGGLSVVLVDGQGSGRPAKTLSNLVAKKAINLLADGTRDGAAARAVHDYLHAYRHGRVSAELSIASADLVARTLVISRNTHCPAILGSEGAAVRWDDAVAPIGLYANTKPVIREVPIAAGTTAIIYSDGIHEAGRRTGGRLDALDIASGLIRVNASAEEIANALLEQALILDEQRPGDDMTVAVLAIRTVPKPGAARRLVMHFPLA